MLSAVTIPPISSQALIITTVTRFYGKSSYGSKQGESVEKMQHTAETSGLESMLSRHRVTDR